MHIINLLTRNLTEAETAQIQQFHSYTDGVSFAYLGDGITLILNIEEHMDKEALLEKADDVIGDTLCMRPDFTYYTMPDGNRMIILSSGACAFESEDNKIDSDNDFEIKQILKDRCLEACEKEEIFALVYDEEYEAE